MECKVPVQVRVTRELAGCKLDLFCVQEVGGGGEGER